MTYFDITSYWLGKSTTCKVIQVAQKLMQIDQPKQSNNKCFPNLQAQLKAL